MANTASGKAATNDSNWRQPRGGSGVSVSLIQIQPDLAGWFCGLTGAWTAGLRLQMHS